MDGSQLVIVALPTEYDAIRTVSSQKEPHLTLLYLGRPGYSPDQIEHIRSYVDHASSLLTEFGLEGVERGELGPKRADVLFFNKSWVQWLEEFRSTLLQDPLISAAYNAIEQYPNWTPHLTLGFPDDPAKESKTNPNAYVRFDRISLWTGDYTGPTFKLRNYDMEVAMSQLAPSGPVVDDGLMHYGVKGMKWGVHRSDAELARASTRTPRASADAKAADSAQTKIHAGGTRTLSNQELQGLITRMNLERQYQSMTAQNHVETDRGLAATKKILKYGKTVEEVRKFLDTPTGKAIKNGVKVAATAGAAYATGGASSAAAAGTSLVVRRAANHYTNTGR